MWNYLLENILPIGIALAGAIAWVFDKRKRDAELETLKSQNKQQEASALSGMQDVYDRFVEAVKKQIEDLREENSQLKERIYTLEQQLIDAGKERVELVALVDAFKKQSERDGILISELKQKVESYEKGLRKFKKERQ